MCYSDNDISYENKAQCMHFPVVCIVFRFFIFKIGIGAGNAWYACTLLVPEMDPFCYGGN